MPNSRELARLSGLSNRMLERQLTPVDYKFFEYVIQFGMKDNDLSREDFIKSFQDGSSFCSFSEYCDFVKSKLPADTPVNLQEYREIIKDLEEKLESLITNL